jgi:phage terminase large subunit
MTMTSASVAAPAPFNAENTTRVFWQIAKAWQEYDVIVLQGGTSSSKTYSALQWLLLIAVTESNAVITITGESFPNMRRGPIRDIATIIEVTPEIKARIVKFDRTNHIYTFDTGTCIEFCVYENEQGAKSGKRDYLFVNEANGIPYPIYDQLRLRTKAKVILDFNPTSKFWAHTHVITEPRAVLLISTFRDNQFCPISIITTILSYRLTDANKWNVYGLGKTGVVEGAIHVKVRWILNREFEARTLRHHGYGLDYGYDGDPLAMVEAGQDMDYPDRIYGRCIIYGNYITRPDLVRMMHSEGVRMGRIHMDDAVAKEQADLLRREDGFNIHSANRRGGSIERGIGLLNEYTLYLVVHNAWMEEQEKYVWIPPKNLQGKPTPTTHHNHIWDALRYWGLGELATPELPPYKPQAVAV